MRLEKRLAARSGRAYILCWKKQFIKKEFRIWECSKGQVRRARGKVVDIGLAMRCQLGETASTASLATDLLPLITHLGFLGAEWPWLGPIVAPAHTPGPA